MRSAFAASAVIVTALSGSAQAGLVGTEASIDSIVQRTPTSDPFAISVQETAVVQNEVIEFTNIGRLDLDIPGIFLVNTDINIDNDFLTIDFDNAGSGLFIPAVENTCIFTFDADTLRTFVNANINPSTSLGLTPSDVTFAGNQLFVNVEGLPFDTSTFAQIDFEVVPLPSGVHVRGGDRCSGILATSPAWRRRVMLLGSTARGGAPPTPPPPHPASASTPPARPAGWLSRPWPS
jgi:hypothetical protein